MKSVLWLPLTALLVFGCNDSSDKVTAPASDLPNGDDEISLDKITTSVAAQVGITARCVQLRYVSETGVISNRQRGSSCSCSANRLVSVTAMIWKGALGNNSIGKAYCTGGIGSILVAGPATAGDPAGGLGVLFGIASVGGGQISGVPGCTLSSTVTNTRDRSNRLVTCVWF
jgi:hypothetical protein